MVKVLFEEEDQGGMVETLWAQPLEQGGFQLDNSPFYAYRVSWQDVVAGDPVADGVVRFSHVLRKSGHHTIRVIFEQFKVTSEEATPFLGALRELGASFEGDSNNLVSIDVPPEIDLVGFGARLTAMGLRWEYADPTYDDLYPSDEVSTEGRH